MAATIELPINVEEDYGPLPLSAVIIFVVGLFMGAALIFSWLRHGRRHAPPDVTTCSVGPPAILTAYRAGCGVWCLSLGVYQLLGKGLVCLRFYTVWNWWLLTAYFAAAFLASALHTCRQHRRSPEMAYSHARPGTASGRARLAQGVAAMLHVMLAAVIVVDVVTWTVLVPMLVNVADPIKRAFWRAEMLSFMSYNQHGVNAVLILGDAVLNVVPPNWRSFGWWSCWFMAYTLWFIAYLLKTGLPIYPFMDPTKPHLAKRYWGMFIFNWIAAAVGYAVLSLKARVFHPKRKTA